VLANPDGLAELRRLGARMVPVVSRGDKWVDGQAIQALADFVGVRWTNRMLAPSELAVRVDTVLGAAGRFGAQLPGDKLGTLLPNGFRSYVSLAIHIGQIIEAFLDHMEQGVPLDDSAYVKPVPANVIAPADVAAFHAGVKRRFDGWWARCGASTGYSAAAKVYYGEQTVHEFFERSAWHAAQHTRQLQLLLEKLGVTPEKPLTAADLAGLPLPKEVWDDKMVFAT
jgi:hypothetical protein